MITTFQRGRYQSGYLVDDARFQADLAATIFPDWLQLEDETLYYTSIDGLKYALASDLLSITIWRYDGVRFSACLPHQEFDWVIDHSAALKRVLSALPEILMEEAL